MAYQAGGTPYGQFLEQRRMSDTGLTGALKSKGEADKRKRIAKSRERSGGQKLLSAVARGAAAYYTGGLSETMGGGEMIDKAMLGADAETNEYGQLVGAASSVYQGGLAQKGAKIAQQDARFDKLMGRRQKNVQMLFDANKPVEAMKAQGAIEDMETDYMSKRKGLEAEKNPFSLSQEDYDIGPDYMSREERAAKTANLNTGGTSGGGRGSGRGEGQRPTKEESGSGLPPMRDFERSAYQPDVPKFRGGTNIQENAPTTLPKPPDAPIGPDLSEYSGPEAYNFSQSGRLDFSNDLLSPEERKSAALQGAYVGPEKPYTSSFDRSTEEENRRPVRYRGQGDAGYRMQYGG